jgi:putative NADPH-quinone reductase
VHHGAECTEEIASEQMHRRAKPAGGRMMKRLKKGFFMASAWPSLGIYWFLAMGAKWDQWTAASFALLYAAGYTLIAIRTKRVTKLDYGVVLFWSAGLGVVGFGPFLADLYFRTYFTSFLYLSLFLVACLPILFHGEPFTVAFARRTTPQIYWNTDAFLTINRIMTGVWGGIFGVCAAIGLFVSPAFQIILPVALLLGVGLPFNRRFPDYYLKKLGLPSLAQQRGQAKVDPEPQRTGPSALQSANGHQGTNREIRKTPARSGEFEKDPFAAGQTLNPQERRKEPSMKVLALNSSPRSDGESKTALMLNPLVKGMREAGAQVEMVELRKKTIRNCSGCFSCWTKTPGVCIHKDDMTNELFPKWLESDLVVYASPLYNFTVNAVMKTFIERTLPVLEPFFLHKDGKTRHPRRHAHPKVCFLSVAGFPEVSVFEQLSSWVNFIYGSRNLSPGPLVAEIYRPMAEALNVPFFREKATKILEATRLAGQEIVESMQVSPETMKKIREPLTEDPGRFLKMGDLMWRTCIAESITPKEFGERGLIPRPDSIETFMMIMPMGFNPEAAGETSATIQFNFSGEVEGPCHLVIKDGRCEPFEGSAEGPDLTIDTPFQVWMDIMTGKADGQQMFMAQKYKVMGDLSLLMRIGELFGKK